MRWWLLPWISADKLYRCDVCGNKYTSKDTLYHPKIYIHAVKTFPCDDSLAYWDGGGQGGLAPPPPKIG